MYVICMSGGLISRIRQFGTRVSQMKCQIVTKENDVNREKQIQSKILGDVELGKQELQELCDQLEHSRDIIGSLHREIKGLHDVISEQKVSHIRLDFMCFFF